MSGLMPTRGICAALKKEREMKIAVLEGDGLRIRVAEQNIVIGVDETSCREELEKLAARLNRFAANTNGLARDLKARGLDLNPVEDIQLFVERHLAKTKVYWRHLSDPPPDNGRLAGELPPEMIMRFELNAHVSTETGRLTGVYHKMVPDKSKPGAPDKRPFLPRLNVYTSFSVVMACMCAGRALQMYVTGEPFL